MYEKLQAPNSIMQEKGFLLSLPLFNGLNDEVLNKILVGAHTKKYPSGSLLFLQGEKVSHLYIIFSGKIKIFRSAANGDESIPQILGRGDTFMETAIFSGSASHVGAEAIDNINILSIPSETVTQIARSDHKFAMNLLKVMSKHSNSLIYQIEQITLKSAAERVGRFLVKTMLESDSQNPYFELPFEKSLIANHLAMTPETLSRALKQLKEDGAVIIDGKKIALTTEHALCRYGDPEIARKCHNYGSKNCPVEYYS
jgi:CRP-like cAMP-binding protein